MQIPVLSGVFSDGGPDFRTRYPHNLVPVPQPQGISQGYLRPADGIVQIATAPGFDRGGIAWNGTLYRVSGERLISVARDGTITELGYVGPGGPVTFDYGFDRLAVSSGGHLYYWDGVALTRVTDPDMKTVKDFQWIAGYFMTTDGEYLVTTDLNDPTSVNPLHYGSAETDPDGILAVDELRNEAYAFGRHTIEVFQNIGGIGFPFQRIEGAQVPRGIVGTFAYCQMGETFAICGGGRNEGIGVHILRSGSTEKISTHEIDTILAGYTEAELAGAVMECRTDKDAQHLLLHLPDQTLVYDVRGTQAVQKHLWHTLGSGINGPARYRARGLVWCYDRWNVGDPTSTALGYLTNEVATHYGQPVGWEFGTMVAYNAGDGAIVHELELVCLSGRVDLGADPVVWTSYSTDGVVWSQERPTRAGRQGQRAQRICWRGQGKVQHMRMQRFRGTSDARLSIARLEARIEPLFLRPGAG